MLFFFLIRNWARHGRDAPFTLEGQNSHHRERISAGRDVIHENRRGNRSRPLILSIAHAWLHLSSPTVTFHTSHTSCTFLLWKHLPQTFSGHSTLDVPLLLRRPLASALLRLTPNCKPIFAPFLTLPFSFFLNPNTLVISPSHTVEEKSPMCSIPFLLVNHSRSANFLMALVFHWVFVHAFGFALECGVSQLHG